jgi:glycosyltransferase involved in cell wall biosynthesis
VTGPIGIVAVGELFGGAERHILGLGAFLRERSLQPHVILFHDRELAAQCRADDLPVHVIPTRSAFDLSAPRRLGRLLADQGIQLVHVHGYKAAVNAALAPGPFAMVATMHGQGEPTWRHPRAFLRDRLYRALEVRACRHRRAPICFVTADLQRRHGKSYGSAALHTVHNGIEPLDLNAFPERPEGLAPERLHALMVGRLSGVKGIDIALRALSLLPDEHPWQLNLVGDGGLRPELEALAASLGVADHVTFHGFRRDVYALMAHSDLLVMSSHHEGLPYTLLEAMSLGLPTLASDVGGLAEVLVHDRTGWLVPVGDVAGFAVGLQRLGEDAGLRERLGTQAAREQRQRYTLTAMGEQYLAIYEAAAGRRA